MLIQTARREPEHAHKVARFLEWGAAIWTNGDSISRFHPSVRAVNELTRPIIMPFLPLSEMHSRIVHSASRNVRDDPHAFAPVIPARKSDSRRRTRLRRTNRKVPRFGHTLHRLPSLLGQ